MLKQEAKACLVGMESVPAANSVCSPPPCGEGLGVGVAVGGRTCEKTRPPPQPSPTRGEGANRRCRSCRFHLNGIRFNPRRVMRTTGHLRRPRIAAIAIVEQRVGLTSL